MTLIRWKPLRDITAWHPAAEFENVQRNIDQLFDHIKSDSFEEEAYKTFMPAVDILERENDFNIKVELPGVEKSDVKITVQNDVLTIRGEKKKVSEKKEENYTRTERSYGIFQRSFTLPASVTSEKIEASYDNGVLSVTIPKLEEAKPQEIEVKIK